MGRRSEEVKPTYHKSSQRRQQVNSTHSTQANVRAPDALRPEHDYQEATDDSSEGRSPSPEIGEYLILLLIIQLDEHVSAGTNR